MPTPTSSHSLTALRHGVVLLLWLPLLAAAQQGALFDSADVAEEVEVLPRYTVEVIIFAYNNPPATTELWLQDESQIEPDWLTATDTVVVTDSLAINATQLSPPDVTDTSTDHFSDLSGIEYPISLRRLPEQQYSMNEIYKRLETLGAYQPLMHFAWTQTVYSEDQATAVKLAVFGKLPVGLDGSTTLYLGRFLHLVMDLQLSAEWKPYEEPSPEAADEPAVLTYADNRVGADLADGLAMTLQEKPVRYKILEDRKVRRMELHYFDHPKFGVIAKTIREEILDPELLQDEQPAELTP